MAPTHGGLDCCGRKRGSVRGSPNLSAGQATSLCFAKRRPRNKTIAAATGRRDYKGAVAGWQRGEAIFAQLHEPDTSVRADRLELFAQQYWMLADFDNYQKLIREATAIYEKEEGRNSEDHADALVRQSNFFFYTGDFAEALRLAEEACTCDAAAFSKDDPGYSTYLSCVAAVECRIGSYDRAERHAIEAVRLVKRQQGEPTDNYVSRILGLGNFYCQKTDDARAEPLLVEAQGYVDIRYRRQQSVDHGPRRARPVVCQDRPLRARSRRYWSAIKRGAYRLPRDHRRRAGGHGDAGPWRDVPTPGQAQRGGAAPEARPGTGRKNLRQRQSMAHRGA